METYGASYLIISTSSVYTFDSEVRCYFDYGTNFGGTVELTFSSLQTPKNIIFQIPVPSVTLPDGLDLPLRCNAPWRVSNPSQVFPQITLQFTLRLGTAFDLFLSNAITQQMFDAPWDPKSNLSFLGVSWVELPGIGLRGAAGGYLSFGLLDGSRGKYYRGNRNAYCSVSVSSVNHENAADLSIALSPELTQESLITNSLCKIPTDSITIYGGGNVTANTAVITIGLHFPDLPSHLIATGLIDATGAMYRTFTINTTSTMQATTTATKIPNAITAFTNADDLAPRRNFRSFAAPLLDPLDWYSFNPQFPLSSSIGRRHPRPRPRTLQAIAAAASASQVASSVAGDFPRSGQYIFWFGGQAVPEYPEEATLPILLSDLWMFDVLGNLTTLLHGDPAETSTTARGATSPVVGDYNAINRPGARHSASLAYDAAMRVLWLYGGAYYSLTNTWESAQVLYEDLWSFSLDKLQWAWWHGSTAPVPRSGAAVPYGTRPPALAAAAIAAYNNTVVLYGGYALASQSSSSAFNVLSETDLVYSYQVMTQMWQFRYGTANSSDNALPVKSSGSTAPGARAYAQLVWRTHATASIAKLVMYGGVLAPARAAAAVTEATTSANSATPETDSAVLAGLWEMTLGSPSLWTRLDTAPPLATAGNRGQPRSLLAAGAHPGGRVFHAMNIASNGDVYLYGGRGHAAGFHVGSGAGTVADLDALPVVTPFMMPLKGRFLNQGSSAEVSYHAFLYTAAELTSAGCQERIALSRFDVMLQLHLNASLSPAGTFSTTNFKVRTLLIKTGLSDFNDASASFFDEIEAQVLKQPVVILDAKKWSIGNFMAINAPFQSLYNGDSSSAPTGQDRVMLVLRIEYDFVGTFNSLTETVFGLSMYDTGINSSMSLLVNGITSSGTPLKRHEHETQSGVKLNRCNMLQVFFIRVL